VPSSMALSRKRSIVSNLPALKIVSILTMFISSQRRFYELKQAPRAWYECLRDFLITNGFKVGKVDPTLFTKTIAKDLFICQIYVDDIIFGSTNKSTCEEFSRIMIHKFEMSMMGELKYFLGFQIKQLQEGTFISQTNYIQDILKKFGMKKAKPIKTPHGNKWASRPRHGR
jgi:hypothetical protein